MLLVKCLAIAALVFVIWMLGAVFFAVQQHIGAVYDPSFGGWLTDDSVSGQYQKNLFYGNATIYGAIAALGLAVVYGIVSSRKKTV